MVNEIGHKYLCAVVCKKNIGFIFTLVVFIARELFFHKI